MIYFLFYLVYIWQLWKNGVVKTIYQCIQKILKKVQSIFLIAQKHVLTNYIMYNSKNI